MGWFVCLFVFKSMFKVCVLIMIMTSSYHITNMTGARELYPKLDDESVTSSSRIRQKVGLLRYLWLGR